MSEEQYQSMKFFEMDTESNIYELLLSYIPDHLKDCDKANSQGYSAEVVAAPKDTTKPVSTRIKAKIGLGRFSFIGFQGETFYAQHKTIGEPVGLNYRPEIYTRLRVYTSGPLSVLTKFLSDLVEASEVTEEGKFTCMSWHICREYWRTDSHVTARPMASVVLPTATKERLVKDIERFLSPHTSGFYLRNGIPYRRSYLFHGVPGTGKTSMVQALAGHFKRSVCFLLPTHPKMTDDSLREAMSSLPTNAIVVFEDIDSLFTKSRSNKVSQSCLTFSGLLNALDGIGDPNGQICILTTNLRDELDPALIRNGRVDMHVEFTYAIAEQMELMWRNFYPSLDDAALATEFSSRVVTALDANGLQVTTSGLQHFFITNMDSTAKETLDDVNSIIEELKRNSSQDMLDAAATSIKKTKKNKKKKKKAVTPSDLSIAVENTELPIEEAKSAVSH